jgi:hypothetical protein
VGDVLEGVRVFDRSPRADASITRILLADDGAEATPLLCPPCPICRKGPHAHV